MPDFLYGGAMYCEEFLMHESMPLPPRAFFPQYPNTDVQGPGPWSPQEVFGHAAAAAKYMGKPWADEAAQLLENVRNNPDTFQELIIMSDMAFMNLLGPRATEYGLRTPMGVACPAAFCCMVGLSISWGLGLHGFNAAVADNTAATAAYAGSEHASEDASNVARDAGTEDTADTDTNTNATYNLHSTSSTTAVTLSLHSSLPSLLDTLTDDEGPPAAVFVLNPAQQCDLQ
ncbi:hypothetical protein DFH09DRAFT_1330190 [Mycena vulgaris]|nr:hypothetical protein DFH09DRAFT_1330190 [Mycena vulgaris]